MLDSEEKVEAEIYRVEERAKGETSQFYQTRPMTDTQQIVGLSIINSSQDILFIDIQDTQYRISALKLRDEVFIQVIGYSDIVWRVTG